MKEKRQNDYLKRRIINQLQERIVDQQVFVVNKVVKHQAE